jgi:uncharacterized MAPEG superfamily protein
MNLIPLGVLCAALMPIACAGIAKTGKFGVPPEDGRFDNRHPREWMARQTGFRARADAAQANCFEALPFFIGAVLIALQGGASPERVQALVFAWLLLRVAFVAFYLADRASARSLVWVAALGVNIAILFSVA